MSKTTDEMILQKFKRTLVLDRIKFGINASTAIATPIAIKIMADKIEGDYEKKALYATGGALWLYQVANTVKSARHIKASKESYKNYKDMLDNLSKIQNAYIELYDSQLDNQVVDVEYTDVTDEVINDKTEEE